MMVRVEGTCELTAIKLCTTYALSPAHIIQINNGEDDMEAEQDHYIDDTTKLQNVKGYK